MPWRHDAIIRRFAVKLVLLTRKAAWGIIAEIKIVVENST